MVAAGGDPATQDFGGNSPVERPNEKEGHSRAGSLSLYGSSMNRQDQGFAKPQREPRGIVARRNPEEKADAEAQVAALEKAEQEAVAAEAGASFAGVYEILQQFGQHYTTKQKNDLKALLEPRKAVSASAGISRAPKFQIPDGTTWAGTGRQPKAFLAWPKPPKARRGKEAPGPGMAGAPVQGLIAIER